MQAGLAGTPFGHLWVRHFVWYEVGWGQLAVFANNVKILAGKLY